MFDNLPFCPLTGLPLEGRATYTAVGKNSDVLYTFKPIGVALFSFQYFLALNQSIKNGLHGPRPDLAALCRAAAERKQEPITLTAANFNEPFDKATSSFQYKRNYFMQLFYELWGSEHKKTDINVFDDFTLACATNAEEFYRILESLIDDGLILYSKNWVVRGDWKSNILSRYQNVMITSRGKHLVTTPTSLPKAISKMPSNSFHFGDGAKVNLVQGDGAVQTNITGDNNNVATGNQNTQTSQAVQPVSLSELVVQLKQAFADNKFDSCRDEIEHELGHVEIQLKKPEPKKSLLERSFNYLSDVAVKSAGPAAASAVIELIKHAPALLAAAGL